MSSQQLIEHCKSLWARFQELQSGTKSNLFILAGILLFVMDTAACFSRYGEWERNPANASSWAPAPWHFWPDPCAIWFLLLIFGVWTRFSGFPGSKISAEERTKLIDNSRKSALLRHLLPVLSQFDRDGKEVAILQSKYFEKQSLPFPDYLFGDDRVSLKVIPPSDAKPKLAAQLFEQLHTAKGKIWFEVVTEYGVTYFRITCSRALAEFVTRQLSVLFSDAVIEVIPPYKADDVDQLVSVGRYRYRYAPAAGKTLGDFSIDPYAQLFAIMDRLSEEQVVSFRVECQPFPAEIITTVNDTLLRNDFEVSYNRGDGWKKMLQQVQAKLPAWSVVCIIALDTVVADSAKAASHFAELDSFIEGLDPFFNQYRNGEQEWEKYTNDEWVALSEFPDYYPTHRSLPFAILSCQELAALAHFPGKGVRSVRQETAAVPSPGPPPLYTKPE